MAQNKKFTFHTIPVSHNRKDFNWREKNNKENPSVFHEIS